MSDRPNGATRIVVVTVVRGRHDHLRAQHRSLAAGRRPPDHVVVVAMADPEVAGIVASGPLADRTSVLPVEAGPRLPLARARNTGAGAALSADPTALLIFLDVDCLVGPGLVEGYFDAWQRTRVGRNLFAGTVGYLPPPDGPTYDERQIAGTPPHPARPIPAPREVLAAPDLRLFWSLSFALDGPTWRAVGGFDEAYDGYGAEDTDFGQRAQGAGARMWWVGDAHAFHQWHPVSRPPVEHLADIVRNANRFHDRWGWFPMEGWLDDFARAGLVDWEPARGRLALTERAVPGPAG